MGTLEMGIIQFGSFLLFVFIIYFILSKIAHKIDSNKEQNRADGWSTDYAAKESKEDVETDAANDLKEKTTNKDINNILAVSSSYIVGSDIDKTSGLVRANSVRSKHIGRDIAAQTKGIVGGEIKGYTEMTAEAREEVVYRMKQEANLLGADAIIDVRFETSSIYNFMEVLVYGTAVKLKKDAE